MVRPPLTLRRAMAKAAKVATNSVISPVATAMKKLLNICRQKLCR